MKTILRTAALLALVLAGCAAPRQETADMRALLPESDLYYYRAACTEPVRRVQELFDSLDMTIQRSKLPDRRRRELCTLFAACRLALLRSGLADDLAVGVSSVRAPDGEPGFFTTRALAAGKQSGGLLWKVFGPQPRNIRDDLAALPADTLAAFSADLQSAEIAARIAEVAELFAGEPQQWTSIARAMSGRWTFLCRPGAPDMYFELTIPDRERKLGTLLKTFFPPRPDGVIHLPKLDNGAEPVVLSEGETFKLRIGTPAPVSGGGLAAVPEVQTFLRALPETGAGWFYLAPGWISGMTGENAVIPAAADLPRVLAVLEVRPDALVLRSRSDWDPLSEAWLLPVMAFGAKPLAELTVSGGQARDSARELHDLRACEKRIGALGDAFRAYASAHGGKFPAADDIEGCRELLASGLIGPDGFICPAARGDTPAREAASFGYDNCSYVYVGGSGPQTPEDFPLVFDWPLNHRGRFHVFTVGGKVLSFSLDGLSSCRKLASFLQSRFRYPEPDFRRLLDVADKLDAKFLKGHSK